MRKHRMQRTTILSLSGILTLAICGCLVCFFLEGYYLPFKPCRPITYPDERRTSEQLSYKTIDSLEMVLSFYDHRLEVQPWPADTGQWRREKIGDFSYLYSCYGVDINRLSTETGCIYVDHKEDSTYIETMLLRSEGGNLPCIKK